MSLTITGLAKRFENTAAAVLNDVSFNVPTGSLTCLLGPSGAGKSTVLNLIAGLEPLDAGTICVAGERIDHLPPHRRPLTLLMQQPQLFAHLDVVDNVAFGLRVRGVDRATRRRRAHELLELVGIGQLARRSVQHLSGGEQQRVALARALAIEPQVLLADEPFASLDGPVRRELQTLLSDLHRQLATTIVLVTHDLAEAFTLADQWVIVDDGRVDATGTPSELLERPSTPSTVRLLGNAAERVAPPQFEIG